MSEHWENLPKEALEAEMRYWEQQCAKALGWASAYFAATQCEAIARVAASRGFLIPNNYPIVRG